MLFNSTEFIFVFLPIAVALHFLAGGGASSLRLSSPRLTSLFFYAWWKPPFIVLPILSIAANFLAAPATS